MSRAAIQRTWAYAPCTSGCTTEALPSTDWAEGACYRRAVLATDSRSIAAHALQGMVLGGVLLWLALLVAAPWARSEGLSVEVWIYWFFSVICHQEPDRSFHAFAHPWAVCHRCAGLYASFALGFLAAWVSPRVRATMLTHPRIALWCLVPLVVDALLVPNVAASRVLTGLLAGAPLGALAWIAADQLGRGASRSGVIVPAASTATDSS